MISKSKLMLKLDGTFNNNFVGRLGVIQPQRRIPCYLVSVLSNWLGRENIKTFDKLFEMYKYNRNALSNYHNVQSLGNLSAS